ncbi:hypothetical protein LCGC14_0420960 [marine sediment metagenome]|uniref:Uncharacterized protein n=1 Tax=marine sediment metagenome TaxID=412755 RepID=A0A0F9SWX2_9ZZZZ
MTAEHKKRLFYFKAWLKAVSWYVKNDNKPQWAIDLLKEAKSRIVIAKNI